jgi:hypothetical protein
MNRALVKRQRRADFRRPQFDASPNEDVEDVHRTIQNLQAIARAA